MLEIHRKLVVIGDDACGKTSMLITFGTFPEIDVQTAHENYVAHFDVDRQHVQLALCDTAAQEEYNLLRPLSYPDSNIILICFAIDSPGSLDNVWKKWISEVLHFCQGISIILVGCRKDLRHAPETIEELRKTSQSPVTAEQGEEVRKNILAYKYLECSARTGEGICQVFEAAARAPLPKFRSTIKCTNGPKCLIL